MGNKTKTRYCKCGAVLPMFRKQCDDCNEVAVKTHNAKVTERRRQGTLPRPDGTRRGEQPAYDQVEYSDWKPRPKPVLLTHSEQEAIDAEVRRREAIAHKRYIESFGLVIKKGRPLASGARSLSPAEIAELQGRYQPPQKRPMHLLPYMGEGVE